MRTTSENGQPFRILLCRRLHLPLPLTLRPCRCGRQLDMFGHHRAACPEVGVLERRGYPLEVAAAQGVSTNVYVRDLDLAAFNVLGSRRLEVVASGLTLFRSAHLVIDTTLVSPLHRDGTTGCRCRRRGAGSGKTPQGEDLPRAAGDDGRARLVVLAAEVGGRWSAETAQFLSALAKARALSVPQVLQGRV